MPGATPLAVSRSCPISPACSGSAGSRAPEEAEASRPLCCRGARWRLHLRWVRGRALAAEGALGKRVGFLPQRECHRQGSTLWENCSSQLYPKVNVIECWGGAAVGVPPALTLTVPSQGTGTHAADLSIIF